MMKKCIIRGRERCTDAEQDLTLLSGRVPNIRDSLSTAAHSGQFLYRWCGFLRIQSVGMELMYPVRYSRHDWNGYFCGSVSMKYI
jgi:hypothetical protein